MSTFFTLAEHYDRLFPVQDETIRFLEAVLPHPGAKLLDIGCAAGSHVRLLCDAGHDVHGIDSSGPMIAVGRQNCPNLAIQVMDMMEVDRLPGPYDMIYSLGNVVSHISADRLSHFLHTLHGLLGDKGFWLFQVVNWDKILHDAHVELPDKMVHWEKPHHGTQNELPEKGVGMDVIFQRRYESIRKDSVQFITELTAGGLVHQNQETLYPITTNQYRSIHDKAGLLMTAQYGSYARAKYDRLTSGGNIMVFQKQ